MISQLNDIKIDIEHVTPSRCSEHCSEIAPFAIVFKLGGLRLEEGVSWTLRLITGPESYLRTVGWMPNAKIVKIHDILDQWLEEAEQQLGEYVLDELREEYWNEEAADWEFRWRDLTEEETKFFFKQSRRVHDARFESDIESFSRFWTRQPIATNSVERLS